MSNIIDKIKEYLIDNGVDMTHRGGGCRHWVGLPNSPRVAVFPPNTKVDGSYFVAIYPDRVVEYAVKIPYNYNDWQELSSRPYDTKEDMLEIVKEFFTPKAWA